jgi:hypothetical protein
MLDSDVKINLRLKTESNLPSVELSSDSLMELDSIYTKYDYFEPTLNPKLFNLESLSKDAFNFRQNYLEQNIGYIIIKNFWNPKYSIEQAKNGLLIFSQLFGKVIQQNATGLLVKEVKDRSKSYTNDSTSRYSESKYGGNYHTDGAEIPPPLPDFLTLVCIRKSKSGGEFKILNANEIHNALLEKHPESITRLHKNFIWDRRGDLGPNGEETFEKPIFSYSTAAHALTLGTDFYTDQNNTLTCEYLRQYIDDGYKKSETIQTQEDIDALNSMDSVLYDDSLAQTILLEPGEILISTNSHTLHGRTNFTDFINEDGSPDPKKQRILLRTWIIK